MTDGDDPNTPDTPNTPPAQSDCGDATVPPPARGWVKVAPTNEKYADLWNAFRDGIRQAKPLAARCGVDYRTAYSAIERGWPEEHQPALRDRLNFWNRQREQARQRELEADRRAAELAGKSEAARWREHRDRWMPVLDLAPELVGEVGKKLRQAVTAATFVRHRKIRTLVDGKVVVVDQAYVDGLAHARATALWCAAFRDAPQAMRTLLGPAAAMPEAVAPELTPAQLEELGAGRLPEGVTEAMLGMLLLAGFKEDER